MYIKGKKSVYKIRLDTNLELINALRKKNYRTKNLLGGNQEVFMLRVIEKDYFEIETSYDNTFKKFVDQSILAG